MLFFKNVFKHLSVTLKNKFYKNKMSFLSIIIYKWSIQREYRIVVLIDNYKFVKVSKKML